MAPYELKKLTVQELGKTRNAMASPEYLWEIEKLSAEKQRESALLQHQVQLAHLKMRTAELAAIRDQLIANEEGLNHGIESVQTVLADLKKVEQILETVTVFLTVVGKVISLA
jgi:DNA repair exonuclease SbcCD ATPase subunit